MKTCSKMTKRELETASEWLSKVQGRCTARCIEASDLPEILGNIEHRLLSIVGSKKALEGVKVHVDLYAGCYSTNLGHVYPSPLSTQFSATYKHGRLIITDIRRAHSRCAFQGLEVELTEAAEASTLAMARKPMANRYR